MLISAAILANQCVIGSLYRQTQSETSANAVKSFSRDRFNSGADLRRECLSNEIELKESQAMDLFPQAFFGYLLFDRRRKSSVNVIRGRISRTSIEFVNEMKHSNTLAVFKNIRLLSFYVSMFLRGFSDFASTYYFVALCIDSGITKVEASFLLSLIGLSGVITRLCHGILIDKKLITALHFQSLAQLTAGIGCMLIGISSNFATLVIFAIVFGASSGVFLTTTVNAMREIVDINQLKGSFGIVTLAICLGGLLGIPASGEYLLFFSFLKFAITKQRLKYTL